jgi:polysaccharide export outer membrane protein
MRHGRRRIAAIATALGLCAGGCHLPGSSLKDSGPAATVQPPVATAATAPAPAASGSPQWTARAAPPSTDIAWHASRRDGEAVAVVYHPGGAQPEVPAPQKWDAPTPATTGPEPIRGQTPEGKKPEGKKDEELPPPHLLSAGPPGAHSVPPLPVPDVPRELAKRALPSYIIEPPDVLLVEAVPREGPLKNDQRIQGQHMVGPDGTIRLGIYGAVFVGGLTLDQAREAIAAQLRVRVPNFDIRDLSVDVLAYNSKYYYVITDGGGYGEQVYPFLITGSETVLDALGRINGLPPVADKTKVWVARRAPGDMGQILPVDWCGIAQRGATATNYQVMPGDRIYVKADHWISTDAWIGKRLSPIERLLGATLLGSETVNSIRNRSSTGSGTTR